MRAGPLALPRPATGLGAADGIPSGSMQGSVQPHGQQAPVVPQVDASRSKEDAASEILAYRERQLRSRFWRTRLGERLLKWFWTTRLGHRVARWFRDATVEELHGYAFWGPVALAIAISELLATSWFGRFEHWPTISTTIGHLQDLDSLWGVPVVGLIGLAAFYAIASDARPRSDARSEYVMRGRGFTLRYGWPLVLGATALAAVLANLFGAGFYERGYWVWGAFALFGIAIPLALARFTRKHVVFPTVFHTFKCLSGRFRWVAATLAAGLAILVFHLALYPWPNLERRPAAFAGLTAQDARAAAEGAIKSLPDARPALAFSTSIRSVFRGEDAWHVYFSDRSGPSPTFTDCFVAVTRTRADASAGCSAG